MSRLKEHGRRRQLGSFCFSVSVCVCMDRQWGWKLPRTIHFVVSLSQKMHCVLIEWNENFIGIMYFVGNWSGVEWDEEALHENWVSERREDNWLTIPQVSYNCIWIVIICILGLLVTVVL